MRELNPFLGAILTIVIHCLTIVISRPILPCMHQIWGLKLYDYAS